LANEMIALELNLRGFWDFQRQFAKGTEDLLAAQREVAIAVAHDYVKAAIRWAPVGEYYNLKGFPMEPKHPRLRESIRLKEISTLPTATGGIAGTQATITMAEHGKFTTHPVKPHWITPRNKPRLQFFWVDAPPDIMAKFKGQPGHGAAVTLNAVYHPGYNPSFNWAEKAGDDVWPGVHEKMDKVAHTWLNDTIRVTPGSQQ